MNICILCNVLMLVKCCASAFTAAPTGFPREEATASEGKLFEAFGDIPPVRLMIRFSALCAKNEVGDGGSGIFGVGVHCC